MPVPLPRPEPELAAPSLPPEPEGTVRLQATTRTFALGSDVLWDMDLRAAAVANPGA